MKRDTILGTVTFSQVRVGQRFRINKRKQARWRGVKIKAFKDDDGRIRNAIEIGTGRFWTVSNQLNVELFI